MRSFLAAVVFSVVAHQLVVAHHGPTCLKSDEKFQAAIDKCQKLIGPQEHGDKEADQSASKDATKCMPLCLLTEQKFLDSKGDIIDDSIVAQIKSMAESAGKPSAPFVTATNDCLTTARKVMEADGGISANPCKFAHSFSGCLHKAHDQLCQSS